MAATTVIDRSACPKKGGVHGTYGVYQRMGCRCPDAREDKRLYEKRRREGRAMPRIVDRVGIIRRIEALSALGHSDTTIAHAMGAQHRSTVSQVRGGRGMGKVATRSLWLRVARAYDKLSGVPGASPQSRLRALARGAVPPIAWEDVNIDDPAAVPDLGEESPRQGAPNQHRPVDVDDLVTTYRRGATVHELAAALGKTPSTIYTYLQRSGITDAPDPRTLAPLDRRAA